MRWKLENLSFVKPCIKEEIGTEEDSKNWIKNHRLRMTRALAEQVTNDYRKKEQRYFKACENYEECDSKRRSSTLAVGSKVLVHTPQPVGVCGKLYSSWKGYFKIVKRFADNPNVYLVCHENDSKRLKLVHREILRVVDVPEEADVPKRQEITVDERSSSLNQQSPEVIAVGSPGLDNESKLKQDFQGKSISAENCDSSEKKLRSGKSY